MKEQFEKIRTQIEKSNVKEALEEISKVLETLSVKGTLKEECTILSSRFNDLSSKDRKGIISLQNANTERNKIIDSVLNLLREIEGELGKKQKVIVGAPKKNTNLLNPKNPKNPKLYSSGTLLFSQRIGQSCPGLRGGRWITKPSTILRILETVLQEPLKFTDDKSDIDGGFYVPIWWFSKGASVGISNFKILKKPILCGIRKAKVLIGIDELVVDKLFIYHATGHYYRDIIYLETKPDKPTNIYLREKGRSIGAREEYAIFKGKNISLEERDDGAAIINGRVQKVYNTEHRIRHLKPFNMIICANDSPYNCYEFDRLSLNKFGAILENKMSFEEAFQEMLEYRRRDKNYFG